MDPIARCAVHPEAPAHYVCGQCGNFACLDCWPPRNDASVCASCTGAREYTPTPWQRRDELGVARALWHTLRDLSFAPQRFFSQLDPRASEGPPYLLLFLMLLPGTLVLAVEFAAFPSVLGRFSPTMSKVAHDVRSEHASALAALGALAVPVGAIVQSFFAAAILHATLWLFGHRDRPFRDSRMLCVYAGCIQGWMVVPFLGLAAANLVPIWTIIGLKQMRGLSWWVASFTVLLPYGCSAAVQLFGALFREAALRGWL